MLALSLDPRSARLSEYKGCLLRVGASLDLSLQGLDVIKYIFTFSVNYISVNSVGTVQNTQLKFLPDQVLCTNYFVL